MPKNFIVSFVTDVETGQKLKDYARKAGRSLSSFSALTTKVWVEALPDVLFQNSQPTEQESLLKDIIVRGCESHAG